MIIWYLDLQLPMQLVPITTNIVSSNPTQLCDKVCQWLATGRWLSLGTLVSSTNKTDCHYNNWNIVESGVKHHKSNLNNRYLFIMFIKWFFMYTDFVDSLGYTYDTPIAIFYRHTQYTSGFVSHLQVNFIVKSRILQYNIIML